MAFAKGRSNLEALIDDEILIFEQLISNISEHLSNGVILRSEYISQTSKKLSEGDDEVESSIRNSLDNYLIDYSLLIECFMSSQIISVYSFYERVLNAIIGKYNLKVKNDLKLSYGQKYVNTIKEYLGVCEFKTDQDILFVDNELRILRNSLTHEGQTGCIYDILKLQNSAYLRDHSEFIEIEFIKYSINKIKSILMEIAEKLNDKKIN